MRVLISGGGTGGHVNPALAMAKIIERNDRGNCTIAYVGTPFGIENNLVPDKYFMYHINIRGITRSITPKNIKTLFLAATSQKKARAIIDEFRPDLVIGTGGYVCWPICRAAALRGIPTVLHESNFEPGFSIKMLESKADIIFVNFNESKTRLSKAKKVVRIGTPLREDFMRVTREIAREKLGIAPNEKYILAYGGSLGATKINQEILSVMKDFGKNNPDIKILLTTGRSGYDNIKDAFDSAGLYLYPNLNVSDYIYDMPIQMAAADLIICRSGALTIAELAKIGSAALLIPSPNVTADQQTKNAKLLADNGAAYMISEEQLTYGVLSSELENLISDIDKLSSMRRNIKAFDIENTDKLFWNEVFALVETRKVKENENE